MGCVQYRRRVHAQHFLVAVCDWDSKEAMLEDMASPEGQKGAADLENFAQAGVSFDFYEITKGI